ncbi:hypothetical protein C8A01DRAFT_43319 [Parachaetomium inaequale]|uniref:Uncharacterized protein n=1 Tax=Parachaetomium inaequale TaxID=2588326 RepID=A0AAN6PN06_9PEZI|nr:hypothetical protein C8A01DRAFT_43319 [Parachaetomium inaequale]
MSELDPRLYTVAWIAPLEIEARAALHMFDNRHHGRFPTARGDDYVFHAGDVCGHNVVLASLPAGGQGYGTGSTAALASQVKKVFPNLWFGLLVGVAAGLPDLSRNPPRDIRLGDVLVALPEGDSAGLVAYDLGKETGKGVFQLLQFGHALATTETVVRSAIGSIKLHAPNDTALFLPYYEAMKEREHAHGIFADPGQDKDVLYEADDHDGPERRVERARRQDSRRTRVWYGPIGSGEKLVRDARKRNELRDRYGVIGLEMEAAGTMNHIRVGVIRGVCDYGDEHKNKEWQPYAAAMAAAYAKAVLREIFPSEGPAVVGSPSASASASALQLGRPSTSTTPCHTVPFPRNEDIVHHAAIFSELDVLLPASRGSGKTQIALEYAHRRSFRDPPCSVFWVHADNETTFAQDYKLIATKRGLPASLGGAELLAAVRQRIEADPCWLLVIDNADDLGLFGVGVGGTQARGRLYDLVPRGPVGTVLWTSRDKRIGGSLVGAQRAINVARMTDGEAMRLLETVGVREIGEGERGDAVRLLAELDWLPLAVSQGRRYLSKLGKRKRRWKVLQETEFDRHRRPGLSNSVLETWYISMDQIQRENKMAYDILHVLAFLDSQNIPLEIMKKAAELFKEKPTGDGQDGETAGGVSSGSDSEDDDDEEVLRAVLRLEEFSFLHIRASEDKRRAYDMHKLVQEATRYALSGNHRRKDEARFSKLAIRIVTELFPAALHARKDESPERRRELWEECGRYVMHAQRVGECAGLCEGEVEASGLLTRVSYYLYERERWREREPVDKTAYEFRLKRLGEKHPDTILSLANLATTYHQQGRYEESEKMGIEVLALRRDVLGERHPETIRGMANLAATYYQQGSAALRRDILGERHPDTIKSIEHLAIFTWDGRKQHSKAMAMMEDSFRLCGEVLGPNHPRTRRCLGILKFWETEGRDCHRASLWHRQGLDGRVVATAHHGRRI